MLRRRSRRMDRLQQRTTKKKCESEGWNQSSPKKGGGEEHVTLVQSRNADDESHPTVGGRRAERALGNTDMGVRYRGNRKDC